MSNEDESSDTPTDNTEPAIELTLDELAFVDTYFEENMNGTRTYMKLHPQASYETAGVNASVTLRKTRIRAEIKRRLDERAMSAEEAIYRLGEIGRADLFPFIRIDDDGFVYFNFADEEAKRHLFLIKKIKSKRERRLEGKGEDADAWEGEWVEVELHDAHAAIRDILKLHGKFIEKMDLTSLGEKLPGAVVNVYLPDNGRDEQKDGH
jgi:hypothetical protein